jgi:hypothetical protein
LLCDRYQILIFQCFFPTHSRFKEKLSEKLIQSIFSLRNSTCKRIKTLLCDKNKVNGEAIAQQLLYRAQMKCKQTVLLIAKQKKSFDMKTISFMMKHWCTKTFFLLFVSIMMTDFCTYNFLQT